VSHRLNCDYIVCFRFLYVCVGVCHSYFCLVVVVLSFGVLLSLLLLVKKKKGSSMEIYI
jgi:hypothetical protein